MPENEDLKHVVIPRPAVPPAIVNKQIRVEKGLERVIHEFAVNTRRMEGVAWEDLARLGLLYLGAKFEEPPKTGDGLIPIGDPMKIEGGESQ